MKYICKAQEVVNGWNGKPIRIRQPEDPEDERSANITVDATIYDIMQVIVFNAPYKTLDDSKEGRRMAEALEESRKSNFIEIDQGTHNWLKHQSEIVAPQIFRINGEIVDSLIREGWEKKE